MVKSHKLILVGLAVFVFGLLALFIRDAREFTRLCNELGGDVVPTAPPFCVKDGRVLTDG